jgi:hypothetical protein
MRASVIEASTAKQQALGANQDSSNMSAGSILDIKQIFKNVIPSKIR